MPFAFRLPAFAAAAVAGALAVLASAATAVRAEEHSLVEPVWIEDAGPDGENGRTIPALLDLPPGWMVGDAAVVVVTGAPWPGRARETLVGLLLGEGAAVLELDTAVARGGGPNNARIGPEPTAAELAIDVRAAVEVLRRDTGAGLVVALGHGEGGAAAVLAASLERTAGRADLAGLAAAASLGPGPARFALGGAEPGRGWPARAGRLCAVLAMTVAATAEARAEEAACGRALSGPPAGVMQAGRRAG